MLNYRKIVLGMERLALTLDLWTRFRQGRLTVGHVDTMHPFEKRAFTIRMHLNYLVIK